VFAAISGLGALNGWILLQGELPNVLAKNGVFPRIFARDSRRLTPIFSLVFTSALVTILILMFYQQSMVQVFTFMTLLSTTACLVLYALCSLALLRLHFRAGRAVRRRRTLAIAVVAALATVYSVWAMIGAGYETMAWGAALLAVGAPVYWLNVRKVTT
jgi:basic amino acid/polyamine antiporter, APA family